MPRALIVLMAEAMLVYFLVLGTHALRERWGVAPFYALLGGVTAIMSWVTDAGLAVDVAGIRFVVGSTVFYTSLLLGVLVVYVFDGPRQARIAISTVAGMSALMPLVAAVLNVHMGLNGTALTTPLPQPSLRINTASVATTLIDLVFLAMAWEFLGRPGLKIRLWARTWITLLGVMWLDVFLFATGAFAGTPQYVRIMQGTLVTRFAISLLAVPLLYVYLQWQARRRGQALEHRPVLSILTHVAEVETKLSRAEQEIERRKRAEAALRESKALLDTTGRLAAVGGWHIDLPSRELRWTEQTRRIHEVPPDYEPCLDEALSFFPKDERMRLSAALLRAMEHGEPYDMELRFVTAQGKERWLRAVCEPSVVYGETVELNGAFQDITERHALERRVQRQERMAAVGQMASGIAHDFRNRVNAILLYADMILQQNELPHRVVQSLQTIIAESQGIADLVQQMLDFCGRSMIKPRPLDLNALVREAAEDLRAELPDGIKLRVALAPRDCEVVADARQLRRALDNLISNACDAMPDGGELMLELARVAGPPDGAIDTAFEPPTPGRPADEEWVRLAVSDTGTGMTDEVRQHLFEPFFTTKDIDQGTGLGLSQVYGIIHQHDGAISVETAAGDGTTVYVYLPASKPDQETDSMAEVEPKGPTILLVEPNPELREAARERLESTGCRVTPANSAKQALALVQAGRWSPEDREQIDVVVTPLTMQGIPEHRLVSQLLNAGQDVQAVGISDEALDEEELARLRAAGFARVVVGPVGAEELEHVVRGVVGEY